VIALLGFAWAHECSEVAIETFVDVEAPAVFVLGERHGDASDMIKAWRVVKRLRKTGKPVRVALEAVHESNQGVLDQHAAREVRTGRLPEALRWDETWGFAWVPYKRLVASGKKGVEVRAAGLDLGPKPDDREVELPEGYAEHLMAKMAGMHHQMSPEIMGRFPTSMAWRDFRIGELAISDWSGEGYLVVLTGRGHVEGSWGTNWQLAKLTDAPVHSVVLGHEGAACLEGDRLLVK
jgi:uncharacterized iron-regulated protein